MKINPFITTFFFLIIGTMVTATAIIDNPGWTNDHTGNQPNYSYQGVSLYAKENMTLLNVTKFYTTTTYNVNHSLIAHIFTTLYGPFNYYGTGTGYFPNDFRTIEIANATFDGDTASFTNLHLKGGQWYVIAVNDPEYGDWITTYVSPANPIAKANLNWFEWYYGYEQTWTQNNANDIQYLYAEDYNWTTQYPNATAYHDVAPAYSIFTTNKTGWKIQANKDSFIFNVSKRAESNATKAYIINASDNVTLASTSYIGDYALFNQSILAGQYYYVVDDANGEAYTPTLYETLNFTGPVYPYDTFYAMPWRRISNEYLDFVDAGYNGGDQYIGRYEIETIQVTNGEFPNNTLYNLSGYVNYDNGTPAYPILVEAVLTADNTTIRNFSYTDVNGFYQMGVWADDYILDLNPPWTLTRYRNETILHINSDFSNYNQTLNSTPSPVDFVYTVSGYVKYKNGTAAFLSAVEPLEPGTNYSYGVWYTDPNGFYQFNVVGGNYTFKVTDTFNSEFYFYPSHYFSNNTTNYNLTLQNPDYYSLHGYVFTSFAPTLATVSLYTYLGNQMYGYVYTDSNGYYQIAAPTSLYKIETNNNLGQTYTIPLYNLSKDDELNFTLTPPNTPYYTMYGFVYDYEDPANLTANLTTIEAYSYPNNIPAGNLWVNSNGSYAIKLATGLYNFVITNSQGRTYYLSKYNLSRNTNQNFTLGKEYFYVNGTVKFTNGTGSYLALVQAVSSSSYEVQGFNYTNGNGEFILKIPSGNYTFSLWDVFGVHYWNTTEYYIINNNLTLTFYIQNLTKPANNSITNVLLNIKAESGPEASEFIALILSILAAAAVTSYSIEGAGVVFIFMLVFFGYLNFIPLNLVLGVGMVVAVGILAVRR